MKKILISLLLLLSLSCNLWEEQSPVETPMDNTTQQEEQIRLDEEQRMMEERRLLEMDEVKVREQMEEQMQRDIIKTDKGGK